MKPLTKSPRFRHSQAFSLVEVVVALAIFVFTGFALVGLLGVGLENSRSARVKLDAATVLEKICSFRRAAPTNDFSSTTSLVPNPQPGFPLPRLDVLASNMNPCVPVYVSQEGVTNSIAGSEFGFLYSITPVVDTTTLASTHASTVYLCLFWPPQASPTNAATGHYELTTTFALP